MARGQRLLHHIVDYAGLFPPSAWSMEDAVREYARQRSGDSAWMLAAFVVPVSRLEEFAAARQAHGLEGTWPISALLGPDPPADAARLGEFLTAHAADVQLGAVEFRPADVDAIAPVKAALPARAELFCELPWDRDPAPWMPAVRAAGARAKIRCGGVSADLIPPVDALARFLRACHGAGVGLKFTAGLHHPVRAEQDLTYDPDPPRAVMHGFLNVFVASGLLATDGIDDATLHQVLSETDPRAFSLDEDGGARWCDRVVPADAARRVREGFARSFGSCSFAEPVDDLQTLDLT